MKMEWFALPLVGGMMFEVGGLQFPAAPFNGWYTSVEIATRDLIEETRLGLMKVSLTHDLSLIIASLENNNEFMPRFCTTFLL